MDNIDARLQKRREAIKATLQKNDRRTFKGKLSASTLNISGTLAMERVYPVIRTQEKTVVSSLVKQEVYPDESFKLSKVTVEPLPITRELNEYGGYTVRIGV